MEIFRKRSRSSVRPMRIVLPCCVTGGFCSMRRIFSSASPPNSQELLARILALTATLLLPPTCTLMLPDPDTTSRSTGPDTDNVRSKWPVWAACMGRTAKATRVARIPRFLNTFICLPPVGCGDLLQDDFVAFFEACEQLGLGSVGDAHGHRNFLLAVLAIRVGGLDGSLAVFVIDQRGF